MCGNRIILLAAVMLCPAWARVGEDQAIADYVRPIIKRYEDPNVGAYEWAQAGFGGYLVRLSADVTGDGKPEMFIASTMTNGKTYLRWQVFDVSEQGYSPYVGEVGFFISGGAWLSENSEKPELLCPGAPDNYEQRLLPADEKVAPLHHYEFHFPRIEDHVENLHLAEFVPRVQKAKPKTFKAEAILLADYLHGSRDWKEAGEWEMDSNDRLWQEASRERAKSNTSFTAQAALALLPSEERQSKLGEKQNASPRSAVGRLDDAKHAVEPGGNRSKAAMVGLAAVIVLACAIVVSVKKRRKG